MATRRSKTSPSEGLYGSFGLDDVVRVAKNKEPPLKRACNSLAKHAPSGEFKKEIKALIRQKLDENPEVKQYLDENRITGRFIKSATNCRVLHTIDDPWDGDPEYEKCRIINAFERDGIDAIDKIMCWSKTAENHSFWCNHNDKLNKRLRNK